MKFRKTTAKTVVKDLRAYADFLEEQGSDVDRRAASANLNNHLDVLLQDDAFGTEGQLDPRGDHRE